MNKANKKSIKANILIHKSNELSNYAIIYKYHLQDKRLTPIEQNTLTKLMIVKEDAFKINTRTTALYVGLARTTFRRVLNNLIKYGYLERTKNSQDSYDYKINLIPTNHILKDFKIKDLNKYTIKDLKYYESATTTPKRYLLLIKKEIAHLEDREKTISQIINEEMTEEEREEYLKEDTEELPF